MGKKKSDEGIFGPVGYGFDHQSSWQTGRFSNALRKTLFLGAGDGAGRNHDVPKLVARVVS